jgi:hypothetical protein
MQKPAVKRFAIKIVIGFGSRSWVLILDVDKTLAGTGGIDRKMYLQVTRSISIEICPKIVPRSHQEMIAFRKHEASTKIFVQFTSHA